MIRILLAASLVGLTMLPSAAESLTKTYTYFSVGGRTLDELEDQLNRRGPQVKSTGRRHPGATRKQFNTRLGYAEKNGSCRVTVADFTVTAMDNLPRGRPRGKAEQDVRVIWDTLSGDIKRHEEQHVQIAQDHARQLERKLLRLGRQKNCAVAAEKAKATADKVLAEHDRAQARFDEIEAANFEKRLLKLLRQRVKMIEAGQIAG
jgi:predicted secreted Zn-dependent protease